MNEDTIVECEQVDEAPKVLSKVRGSFTMDPAVLAELKKISKRDKVSVSALLERAATAFVGL